MRLSDRIALSVLALMIVGGVIAWALKPPSDWGDPVEEVDAALRTWYATVADEASSSFFTPGSIRLLSVETDRHGRRVARWDVPHRPIVESWRGGVWRAEVYLVDMGSEDQPLLRLIWRPGKPRYSQGTLERLCEPLARRGVEVLIADSRQHVEVLLR